MPAPSQAELGALPEWNLSHLYPGMDSEAFKGDLARAEAECKAFAAAYRGKLDEMARDERASERLDEVVKRYEALEDLLGRLMSYAGLVYSGDTTDPIRAKFYGDTQERLTAASTELLFFGLELNRIEDAVLDKAMSTGPLAHYRPWIEDLRKDKPYQLEDKIEQLFHEKSVTGQAVEDLLGRLMSYAGLVYSGDTTDPTRAKFYGDTQERLTAASSDLLFFGARAQPHRRRGPRRGDGARRRSPITGPGSRICARTSPTSSTTRSSSSSTRSP